MSEIDEAAERMKLMLHGSWYSLEQTDGSVFVRFDGPVGINLTDLARAALTPRQRYAPWKDTLLHQWSIVGMNHYYVGGERRLFVALCKNGYCIKEEGPDCLDLWNRLWHKALASPAAAQQPADNS